MIDVKANGLLGFYIAIDAHIGGFPFFGPRGGAHLQMGFKTGGTHFIEGLLGMKFQCIRGVVEAAAGDAVLYQSKFFGSGYRDFVGVAGKFTLGMWFGDFVVFNAIFMDFESNGIGYHPIEFFGFYGHQQVVVVHFLFYLIPKFLIVIGVFVHHISIEVIFYFDGAIF